jgi:hypothetical protein
MRLTKKIIITIASALFCVFTTSFAHAENAPNNNPTNAPRMQPSASLDRQLQPGKRGYGYYDVYVINYRYDSVMVTAEFQNHDVVSYLLHPYGVYPYIDRINMYFDDYLYLTVKTLYGKYLFSGVVHQGDTVKIWP